MCCCWLFALPVRQPAWGVGRVRFASRTPPRPPLGAFLTTLAGWALFPRELARKKECGRNHLHGTWLVYSEQAPKIGLLTKKHVHCWGRSGKQKVSWKLGGPACKGNLTKPYRTLRDGGSF